MMSKLFEDSDSDIEFKTENNYAKAYDGWRKKEELNKFKARHGEHSLDLKNDDDDDESSSEDDETGVELTEQVEKDFYKTLALLKKKDPKIYDDKVEFFSKVDENEKAHTKTPKEKKMFLRDYERNILLENGGNASDSEIDEAQCISSNLEMVKQNELKESFKALYEDSDEDIGSLLKPREATNEEDAKKEEDYKAWLIGHEKKLKDKEIAASLKPLRDYWNDNKLDEGEKFLRDYLLNNRYLEKGNKNYVPTYNEIVQDLSEDEEQLEKQEEFEHKYNFRYEEPDQEFMKRYPRTIEGSLRREDNRRKLKRQEIKERKAKEKEEKMEDLRKLRDIQRKEIEEKIEKLKEITGNKEIAFNDEDVEGDFDPEEHDRRMQALFNDEYYQDGPEEDVKPQIDSDDEDALELQPENYDNWTRSKENEEEADAPHCEDDNFIMDADYDPKATQKELVENSRKRKKRKKKSKFVEMLAKERPKFDPMDKSYEKYVDEYYKFECEDIIDDVPCKFKYRKVVPNNFGLSVEEILSANDRELNKWCSLKKAVSLRDEHVEKYEQIAYEKKGQNINLKKKIIPSLFVEEEKINEENDSKLVKIDKTQKGTESNESRKKENSPSQSAKKMRTSNEEDINETEITHKDSDDINSAVPKKKRKGARAQDDVKVENSKKGGGEKLKMKKIHSEKQKITELIEEEPEKHNEIDSMQNIEHESGYSEKGLNTLKKKKKHKKEPKNIDSTKQEILEGKEDELNSVPSNGNDDESNINNLLVNDGNTLKRKKKKKKGQQQAVFDKSEEQLASNEDVEKKRKKKQSPKNQPSSGTKRKFIETSDQPKPSKKPKKNLDIGISDSRIACFGWNPKKFKNKLIYGNKDQDK